VWGKVRKWIVLLLFIGGLLGTSYLTYHDYILDKFEAANADYANNAYMLAAEKYLDVLDSLFAIDEHETAAYLLILTLRAIASPTDVQKFINTNQNIHPYFIEILARWRNRDQGANQAREALDFLSFVNPPYSRASLRLINYMDARLPVLKTASTHARAWAVDVEGIADIAADPQGNLWAVATNPSRIIRFDYFGHVIQETPFILPKELPSDQHFNFNFNVMEDGSFFVANTKFNKAGKEVKHIPFDDRLSDISRSGNQQLLVLLSDGIRSYNSKLMKIWEKIGHGSEPNSFSSTTAIANNKNYIVVLSWYRLQVLNLEGELKYFIDGEFSWAWDITIDDKNFIYLGSINDKRIDVYNKQAEKISTLKFGGDHLAVADKNILYSVDKEILTAHYPVPNFIPAIDTPSLPTPSNMTMPDEIITVAFTATKMKNYPHISVHSNTDFVLDSAYIDSEDPTIWLGTEGGLVSYRYAKKQWKKWTVAEGLSDAQTRKIVADDDYLWMITGSSFMRFGLQDKTIDHIEPASRRSFNIRDIIPDKNNADWLWLLEQDKVIRYSKSTNTGEIFAKIISGISIQQIDNGDLVINDSYTKILRLNSTVKTITTLVNIEEITAQKSHSPSGSRDTWLGDITVDDQRQGLWIGLYYDNDMFFFNYASNTLKRIIIGRNVLANCQQGPAKIELIDDKPYYFGPQCIAKLANDGDVWELVVRNSKLVRGSLFRTATDSRLWLTSYNGLFSIDEGNVIAHRPPWKETARQTRGLLNINNNLWVAGNPISIFDTKNRLWKTIPNTIAKTLRFYDGAVIAISYRGLYTIDPVTLAVNKLPLGKTGWKSLNDVAFDGTTWWAVGGQNSQDRAGLRAWNGSKEQRWTRDEGMPFGEAKKILLDPCQTDFVWLASDDGLVRFSKSKQTAEIVKNGYVSYIEIHENLLYAVLGRQLFIWNCETEKAQDITIKSETPLDHFPDRLKWYAYQTLSTELKSILKIYPGYIFDAETIEEGGQQSVWLSTHDGILEMTLPAR